MPNYCVVPMFWGATLPKGANDPNFPATPYLPDDLRKALESIVGYGFFDALAEYGAGEVVITEAFPFKISCQMEMDITTLFLLPTTWWDSSRSTSMFWEA